MTLQNDLEKRHDPPPTIYRYLLHWFALDKDIHITIVFYGVVAISVDLLTDVVVETQ